MTDPDESDTDAGGDPDDVAGHPTDVGDAGAFGNDEEQSKAAGGAHGDEGGVNGDPGDVDPQHGVGNPAGDLEPGFDDGVEEVETEVVEWSDVYDSEEEAGAGDAAGAAAGASQGDAGAAGSASGDATPDQRDGTAAGGAGTDGPANADADAGGGPANAGGPSVPANADAGGGPTTGADTAAAGAAQRGPDEKFCQSCGAVIKEAAVVCPECGVEQANAPQPPTAQASTGNGSDPGVAALLSVIGFFIPFAAGAGQLYNGDVGKALIFTIVQLGNIGLLFFLIGFLTVPIFYPIVGIISIYDAYQNADA